MADTSISTIIRDCATAVGIVCGGLWAVWRWGIEERLRRHREFPALDGEVSTAETKLDQDHAVVMVNSLWRNKGKLPIDIDASKTLFRVYRIDPHLAALGPYDPEQLQNPQFTTQPLFRFSKYVLEPSTDSPLQQCIVLPSNQTFVFHWALCIAAKQPAYPYLKTEMWCVRYHLWRSSGDELQKG